MNTAIKKRRAGLGIQGRLMASFALILVLAGISSVVSWISFGNSRALVADITNDSLPSIIRQMELAMDVSDWRLRHRHWQHRAMPMNWLKPRHALMP